MPGLVLRSLISKPLQQATQMSKEMNMGPFTMRLNMKRKDEIGEMAVAWTPSQSPSETL